MHLSRKQTILIVTLTGVAALLLVGLLLFLSFGRKRNPIPAEPSLPPATAAPADTPTPVPTVEPTATPSPTPYFLPLVPEGTAPSPANDPDSTPSPAPENTPEAAVRPLPDTRDGIYNDDIKEFMAIGTQNGEAIAVLLVRIEPPEATVFAIPSETLTTVYTLGENAEIRNVDTAPLGSATARAEGVREGCWNLIWAVKNLTGYRAPAYLCMDFGCMKSFFSFASSLPADGGDVDYAAFLTMLSEEGETRAASMGRLGVGAVRFLNRVSLWDLPSFKSATRGAFASNLSVFDLLALAGDLKKVKTFSVSVLPTERKNGVRVLSDTAVLPF